MDRSAARVATGFAELDRKLGGGLLRGIPFVLGARTGHGKSALALGMTRNIVRRGGKAIVFSLEDAARQYVDRVLAMETGIPTTELEKGGRDLSGPADRLPEGWWLDDSAGLTGRAIARRARLLAHRAGRVDLVVVDYAQLVRSEKAGLSPHQVIAEAMADLAKVARDLDCPVGILSQINRRVEHEQRAPTLADLKESGSLEEVAKLVLLAHRPGFGTENDHVMDVHIAKSSFSGSGAVKLRWEGPLTRLT
jgi:replicative DNA helicase